MNFDDTPEESNFRRDARGWLKSNGPQDILEALSGGGMSYGSLSPAQWLSASKAWQKLKYEAGRACIHWPAQYGGRDASAIERIIWQQEEKAFLKLETLFVIGQGMCAPTLMAYASEEQKRRLLPKIASGEEVWCQLFSEPSGGSDLAGLRTRARRVGDSWVINGQKVWTSFAQHSDYGILLTRTDPDAPKHAGLTMFFVDMHSPGLEVRPIRQANGESEFNEVFFTDVSIPDAQRLGEVNMGWRVSITTLMNERLTVGGIMPTGLPELVSFCQSFEKDGRPAIEDGAIQSMLAHWAARASGLKNTALRSMSALLKGEEPGPENSISKIVVAQLLQDIAVFSMDLQGEMGTLTGADAAAGGYFQSVFLRSPAVRIEGGTDEILRNIIAERVLGLPADIRVDKGVPFNQIPTRPI